MTDSLTSPQLSPPGPPDGPRTPKAGKKPRKRRSPVRHFLIVSHRWTSLVLGLLLVVVTTSGVVVLYQPELHRLVNGQAFSTDQGHSASGVARVDPVTLTDAVQAVRAAQLDFEASAVYDNGDVYAVYDTSYENSWTVDHATGEVLGHVHPDPTWLGFSVNLHECLLSCKSLPGYIPALTAELPHTAWLGRESDITVGGLLLGLMGVLLLFLCVSGLWLWFPRPKRWKQGFAIRWNRGRFARDTDLHKVIGVLALAPLLVWGLTGTGYEMDWVEKAWFAVLPGSEVEGPEPVQTAASPVLPVTEDAAVALALAAHPGTRAAALVLPSAEDPHTTVWLSTPYDPYGRMPYPGDVAVEVDPATGAAQTTYGFPEESLTQTVWQAWNFPVHSGFVVNGWWRLLWVAFGLTPLALMVTGVSTWLVRRATAKSRRAAQRARATA